MKDDSQLLRARLREAHRCDEAEALRNCLAVAALDPLSSERIVGRARPLLEAVRSAGAEGHGIDAFLHAHALSSREGIALMCLAEALLRVPDPATRDRLIRDKLGDADWGSRLGASSNPFVNASTWALLLTGRLLRQEEGDDTSASSLGRSLRQLAARAGEPLVREAVAGAMRLLGRQFVLGRDIAEALRHAADAEQQGWRHSYDMLGEAARSAADARRYFDAYAKAIAALGSSVRRGTPLQAAPSISVKLSALHPRYEPRQHERVSAELLPRVLELARSAREHNIGLTIDAEESERLELSLDLMEALCCAPELSGWDGLGLAVQAYQKRALPLIAWLADLARRSHHQLPVRLVKGAYWDSEIKRTQELGLSDYPVFTRKSATDVSYLACARRLLADPVAFRPAFATHNAHTVAAIAELAASAPPGGDWEFQRLHGMGKALYQHIIGENGWNRACRVYAPVGNHEDLLAYLVRRLLENGANSSFVNQAADTSLPLDSLLADPTARAAAHLLAGQARNPGLPLPRDLYRAAGQPRENSAGLDLNDISTVDSLRHAVQDDRAASHIACPLIDGHLRPGEPHARRAPGNLDDVVGGAVFADEEDIARALDAAARGFPAWSATPAARRALALERAAELLQERMPGFIALIVREGGRTLPAALAEVREAIDFCRYYAQQARQRFGSPEPLPGPTGESNSLQLEGRGVFICISPWNFPLAIFTGQVAAALAAGNTVIAKPAEQTPLTAMAAVRLLHEAGIPATALHLLPGAGEVGAALIADPRCAGVAFTGSTAVARDIARLLAAGTGPLVPLIAETGGQNALIADSTALPEQVVRDALASAFDSAGQRCSALRLLCLQADIADRVIPMLAGAMAELVIGPPNDPATDVGPLIDDEARAALETHVRSLGAHASPIHVCTLDPARTAAGSYFPPQAWEIDSVARLRGEVFGPVLHVLRWQPDELDALCDAIAATGYGLTLGIHSRIGHTVTHIRSRLKVGNTYVNRNIIGAAVGSQPFGGEGLSGTGPKAGGPHYLLRFATERTLSVDTTAAGGNTDLLAADPGFG
ncbi:bifunctional proline dehydrogenase/L-glutamate gamma-semialdehyde dehydrogenase PutA [Azoarcus sp. TTM-91]|uniref:bifunctional proline dehydrogenase/L-glutamate gamma-semialdehyde dehydrogenase PutA n=1 Tax=Azoarcus sp. TTM-91 TaxID=2691581 RepID=UPI00145E94E7|nr:bifunctional proline dehydrogenase/L-glutamate gamma-semialdehyde dehydrogenase PutA [Azoarcus sp. TTM-91]NMG33994.1 bifunctional proline dehydrogenase/L-glutamate gamma-semialdehyde dehydrogenase PutA [Azoarcus sp. TTM-91]